MRLGVDEENDALPQRRIFLEPQPHPALHTHDNPVHDNPVHDALLTDLYAIDGQIRRV